MFIALFSVAILLISIWLFRQKGMISQDAQEKMFQQKQFIGSEGIAKTDLKPSGYVVINHEKHPAISDGPYIREGEKIEVLSQRGETLVVTKKE